MTASLATLWFGASGGLVAWSLHLVLGYFLISAACAGGETRLGGPTAVNAAYLGLSFVLALVAGAATLAAFRTWRSATGWRGFMGLFGMLLSILGLATILLGATQPLALPPCA